MIGSLIHWRSHKQTVHTHSSPLPLLLCHVTFTNKAKPGADRHRFRPATYNNNVVMLKTFNVTQISRQTATYNFLEEILSHRP